MFMFAIIATFMDKSGIKLLHRVLGPNPYTCDIHEAIDWIYLPVMWMIDLV
jgi:hypothetical protein